MPKRESDYDNVIDDLFQQPLSEFTAIRNALAKSLQREGRPLDAERVKALAKPPAPAWAVNQLYWQDPKAIAQLLAIGGRIRKAQTGQLANADLRELLDQKKRMMSVLTERASAILVAAGHAASPDAMRRVSATLESLAVWGDADGVPRAGRLTADLDPPGFDALAALMSGKKGEPAKVLLFRSSKPVEDKRRAREAVQEAENALREARREAKHAETAKSKADAKVAGVEKQKQAIDERYVEVKEEARTASIEAKKAAQAIADAQRALAKARAALDE